MDGVIRFVAHLRVDQAAGTVPQRNQPFDAFLHRQAEIGLSHDRVFPIINLSVCERIRKIAHIRIGRKRSVIVYIFFGYFYPFIAAVDVLNRSM